MRILVEHSEIVEMCEKIGKELSEKFAGKNPLVVCVLKGACPFHSELIKHMDIDLEVDYIQVSSYKGTKSTGNVQIKRDFDQSIEDRHVILVEDIVDTGVTLNALKPMLQARHPLSVTVVSMLDKPSKRKVEFVPDYVGKTIDDLFVIGFGLDLDEKYRNLKDIYVYNED